mmetsp:Transcript_3235/g.3167  ORF Transcript_3235/g.3167 Transcript_3235/m.3167 type:complete len:218 (+) Transcript_3235:725-1378(+)
MSGQVSQLPHLDNAILERSDVQVLLGEVVLEAEFELGHGLPALVFFLHAFLEARDLAIEAFFVGKLLRLLLLLVRVVAQLHGVEVQIVAAPIPREFVVNLTLLLESLLALPTDLLVQLHSLRRVYLPLNGLVSICLVQSGEAAVVELVSDFGGDLYQHILQDLLVDQGVLVHRLLGLFRLPFLLDALVDGPLPLEGVEGLGPGRGVVLLGLGGPGVF